MRSLWHVVCVAVLATLLVTAGEISSRTISARPAVGTQDVRATAAGSSQGMTPAGAGVSVVRPRGWHALHDETGDTLRTPPKWIAAVTPSPRRRLQPRTLFFTADYPLAGLPKSADTTARALPGSFPDETLNAFPDDGVLLWIREDAPGPAIAAWPGLPDRAWPTDIDFTPVSREIAGRWPRLHWLRAGAQQRQTRYSLWIISGPTATDADKRLAIKSAGAFAFSVGSFRNRPCRRVCQSGAAVKVIPAASERAVVPLSVEPRLPAHARTYVDRKDRLRVKLPSTWHRASDRATDQVSFADGNVLAVGTFPIRPRAGVTCSGAPDEPRVEVGPNDALILVEEDVRARPDLARKRPRFRLLKQVAQPGAQHRTRTGVLPAWNCRNQVGISGLRETSFADRGRVFSVTVIIGKAATTKTRSETLGILNSLKPIED